MVTSPSPAAASDAGCFPPVFGGAEQRQDGDAAQQQDKRRHHHYRRRFVVVRVFVMGMAFGVESGLFRFQLDGQVVFGREGFRRGSGVGPARGWAGGSMILGRAFLRGHAGGGPLDGPLGARSFRGRLERRMIGVQERGVHRHGRGVSERHRHDGRHQRLMIGDGYVVGIVRIGHGWVAGREREPGEPAAGGRRSEGRRVGKPLPLRAIPQRSRSSKQAYFILCAHFPER